MSLHTHVRITLKRMQFIDAMPGFFFAKDVSPPRIWKSSCSRLVILHAVMVERTYRAAASEAWGV